MKIHAILSIARLYTSLPFSKENQFCGKGTWRPLKKIETKNTYNTYMVRVSQMYRIRQTLLWPKQIKMITPTGLISEWKRAQHTRQSKFAPVVRIYTKTHLSLLKLFLIKTSISAVKSHERRHLNSLTQQVSRRNTSNKHTTKSYAIKC